MSDHLDTIVKNTYSNLRLTRKLLAEAAEAQLKGTTVTYTLCGDFGKPNADVDATILSVHWDYEDILEATIEYISPFTGEMVEEIIAL